MEKKFKILRFLGTVYKVFGIIVGVVTILSVIGTCLFSVLGGSMVERFQRELRGAVEGIGILGSVVGGVLVSLVLLLYGGGLAITLYAAGEGVYLLIALEENTRQTAQAISSEWDYSTPPPQVG